LVVFAWSAGICAATSYHTMDAVADGPTTNLDRLNRWPYRLTTTVSRSSWAIGIGMTVLAAIGLAIWLVVVWRLLAASPDVSNYYVTAYGGGAAGVVAFTLGCFAALLLIRQATGAPRSVDI